MPPPSLDLLEAGLAARRSWIDPAHEAAIRLFNGYTEGIPGLTVDLYARTAVIQDAMKGSEDGAPIVQAVAQVLSKHLGWLEAILVKTRKGGTPQARRGRLLLGARTDTKIRENGIWYAVDLRLNRDASLYLDARGLRKWLFDYSHGKVILNTFAHTGSLGVAAAAGGAARVVQHDLNHRFLNVAKTSYALNGFPVHEPDFIASDFFAAVGRFKRDRETFDCVILDPPFFSATSRGRVDQVREPARMINKVRPLIRDGGRLVAVNNAVFVSGADYMKTLDSLCADGYLEIVELVPVPQDVIGFNPLGHPVTDPSPFNHSTKIVILSVRKK